MSKHREPGATMVNMPDRRFVISAPYGGKATLVRLPDGHRLTAASWDDVWSACPEFGVTWTAVSFDNDEARDEIVKAWGSHPDMP